MVNIPLYDWNSIYTTNYDRVIEIAFQNIGKPLRVASSNFNFGRGRDDGSARLYKVHGTIETDVIDGSADRIIITDEDYELTVEFRGMIWDRLRADLAENDCIIIGQSLEDSHLKDLISKISELKSQSGNQTQTTILLYNPDPNRAALYTRKNMRVAFGGIDDFFA